MRSEVVGSSVGLVAGVSIAAATYFCARSKLFYPVALSMVPVGYMVGRVVAGRKEAVSEKEGFSGWDDLEKAVSEEYHQDKVLRLRALYREGDSTAGVGELAKEIPSLECAEIGKRLAALECSLYYPGVKILEDGEGYSYYRYRGLESGENSVGEAVAQIDLLYALDEWYAGEAAKAGYSHERGLWRALQPFAGSVIRESPLIKGFSEEASLEARYLALKWKSVPVTRSDKGLVVTRDGSERFYTNDELLGMSAPDLIEEVTGEKIVIEEDQRSSPISSNLIELMTKVGNRRRGADYFRLLEALMLEWMEVRHRTDDEAIWAPVEAAVQGLLEDASPTSRLAGLKWDIRGAYVATFPGTSPPLPNTWAWRVGQVSIDDRDYGFFEDFPVDYIKVMRKSELAALRQ